MAKILDRSPKPLGRDGSFHTVDYDSVVFSNFLNQKPEVLLGYLKEYVRDFLKGFFDAEGHVSCSVDVRRRRMGGLHVRVANTNLDYLRVVSERLHALGFEPRMRRTNMKGQRMTIRGRTWVRRNDVYHVNLNLPPNVRRFRDIIGFENAARHEKLNDLIHVFMLKPRERFAWFMSHYRKEGRKWVKISRIG